MNISESNPKQRYTRTTRYLVNRYESCTLSEFLRSLHDRTPTEFIYLWKLGKRSLPLHYNGIACQKMEQLIMAKQFEWNFVNIQLKEADKKAFADYVKKQGGTGFDALEDITELGYKVSISWVDNNSSYCVSVSGTDRSLANNKKTITSWSSNLEECMFIASYKVLVIASDGNWEDHETENANWG